MALFTIRPVPGPVTSEFGVNRGNNTFHGGVDFGGMAVGTPIKLAADAICRRSPSGDGTFGNWVLADHPDTPWWTAYCHLERFGDFRDGELVKAGTVIGYVGFSGYVIPADPGGAHLHWGMCRNQYFPSPVATNRGLYDNPLAHLGEEGPMAGVLGIDTSHYPVPGHSAVPTQKAIDCAWNEGARYWIVGLQKSDVYLPTIRALAKDGRFRVEVYTYLYQSLGPDRQIKDAVRTLQDAGLLKAIKRLWLDYETGAELPGDGEVAQIKNLVNLCESYGVAAGWYSGNWWTEKNITPVGLAQLADIPYWIAYYIGGAAPIPGQPVHTKQFQGTTTLCGTLNVDLNWRPQAIWDAEEGGDDLATPDDLLKAARAMNREQLGELNNILQQAALSIVGAPAKGDAPELYARKDAGEVPPYNKAGDITRALYDHWLLAQAKARGNVMDEVLIEREIREALEGLRITLPEEGIE